MTASTGGWNPTGVALLFVFAGFLWSGRLTKRESTIWYSISADQEWSSWGPHFKNVRCPTLSSVPQSATSAVVRCTCATINDPSAGMTNENLWDVDLQRYPTWPWLINSYGQG
jgi:hypothetical protein